MNPAETCPITPTKRPTNVFEEENIGVKKNLHVAGDHILEGDHKQ
jgi:hypothetical protein